MKTRLLLLTLLFGAFTFAQTWTQVGTTQFTDFASDGAITFDAANGDIYVVYSNVLDANKTYVEKFDGTSWSTIGLVSGDSADNVAIKINPFNNQLVVAYRNTSNNGMYAYKYDGTSWSSIFTNVNGGLTLSDHRLQIQFNATGTVRVAGRLSNQKLLIAERATDNTGPNLVEVLINSNNSFNNDHRYDFTAFGEYYVSQETGTNSGLTGRKNVGSANNAFDFTNFINGAIPKNISGISDSNYHTVYNLAFNEIRLYNGNTFVTFENGSGGLLELRKSNNDGFLYWMYANTSEDIVFKSIDPTDNSKTTLPSLGLSNSNADFFIKMAVSEFDGNLYALYQDGGKISVQKYNIVAPLNLPLMYVDADATGANDGSSWADAYASLTDCLDNLGASTNEIWVADGAYTPTGNGSNSTFLIDRNNFKIYGGFDGTETQLSDRDLLNNAPTIFEGDVNGDDNSSDPYNSTRGENIERLLHMDANDFEIDGVTFQNGNADNFGSAIFSDFQIGLTIRNCKFLNNSAKQVGAIYHKVNATINAGSTSFIVENCEFDNNVGRFWGTAITLETSTNATVNISLTNNLFTNNSNNSTFTDNSSGSSTVYFMVDQSNSSINGEIVNCTFANNSNFVSSGTADSSVIALAQGQGTNNTNISNCIIYGNSLTNNSITPSVGKMNATIANQIVVLNSIGEDNFSNLTFISNSSDANPLFESNTDFRLSSGSPAIDLGDNSKLPSGITTDLDGNQRVFNTTVDMGAYEFDATLSNTDFVNENNFKIYPNPVSEILTISSEKQIKTIEIYSLLGSKIIKIQSNVVNVSTLENGVYLIKITDKSNQQTTKRFIKN